MLGRLIYASTKTPFLPKGKSFFSLLHQERDLFRLWPRTASWRPPATFVVAGRKQSSNARSSSPMSFTDPLASFQWRLDSIPRFGFVPSRERIVFGQIRRFLEEGKWIRDGCVFVTGICHSICNLWIRGSESGFLRQPINVVMIDISPCFYGTRKEYCSFRRGMNSILYEPAQSFCDAIRILIFRL